MGPNVLRGHAAHDVGSALVTRKLSLYCPISHCPHVFDIALNLFPGGQHITFP